MAKLASLFDNIVRNISSVDIYGIKIDKIRSDNYLIISKCIFIGYSSSWRDTEYLGKCFDDIIYGDSYLDENNTIIVKSRFYYEPIDKTLANYINIIDKTNYKIKEVKDALVTFDKMLAESRHITNIFKVWV